MRAHTGGRTQRCETCDGLGSDAVVNAWRVAYGVRPAALSLSTLGTAALEGAHLGASEAGASAATYGQVGGAGAEKHLESGTLLVAKLSPTHF